MRGGIQLGIAVLGYCVQNLCEVRGGRTVSVRPENAVEKVSVMDEFVVLFKGGRFHMEEVSFCIPDGYYLCTDPDEPLGDVSIKLLSPDKTHGISIHVAYSQTT